MATASVLRFPHLSLTATPELPSLQPRPERRRTKPQQGRALEVLGHAIEYLVDSRLPEGGILMACSRSVFEESVAVVPVHQRVQDWVQDRFRKRHA